MSSGPKNIAIAGASGNVGKHIVNSLLATGKHNVTAVTRADSQAIFPSGARVVKGDLSDIAFIRNAVRGQDVVIIALSAAAAPTFDENMIRAAADAGVQYILPNEFSSQDRLRQEHMAWMFQRRIAARRLIEELGRSKWIALIHGTWYDFSLERGRYQIDVQNRKAVLWSGGNTKANVTTLPQVGQAVAGLLSLSPTELDKYANGPVFFSSFLVSQRDILDSVQRATATSDKDWKIENQDINEVISKAKEALKHDPFGPEFVRLIYAIQFLPGAGGDFETELGTANEKLGLKPEDLDEVTKKCVGKILKG